MTTRDNADNVAGLLAVLVWLALALQLYLIVAVNAALGVSAVTAVVRYFTFFTILTKSSLRSFSRRRSSRRRVLPAVSSLVLS